MISLNPFGPNPEYTRNPKDVIIAKTDVIFTKKM